MAEDYSVEMCNKLKKSFFSLGLHRPMRMKRYDDGDELNYEVTGIESQVMARLQLRIQKFAGGGFAGQVYKVRILKIHTENDSLGELKKDGIYAMKILIPPSGFSLLFRNLLYWLGFQGPFQLQVNPIASRAGALWQKFIRRGAKIQFGDEDHVNDIHGTFVDTGLGSCGELSDWVDGRTWRLEVDDHLDVLKRFLKKRPVHKNQLGSPEYRYKKQFMSDFVVLLHDMGAHEFARQYEWSTCKSQPNCLKRTQENDDPSKGLVAVDFRAGLSLLPFLPMSPGDIKLIIKGLFRGSLVQFDRGNLKKLEAYINSHPDEFIEMQGMLEELKQCEEVYRNSTPDITHNFFRLFYSKKLWSTLFKSTISGWKTRNLVDDKTEIKLKKSKLKTCLFYIPGIIPVLGKFIRKMYGRKDWRQHYGNMLKSWDYIRRSFRGKIIERLINWHRAGRIDEKRATRLSNSFFGFFLHMPLSIFPIGLHKLLTDGQYLKERLTFMFIRPIKLYFSSQMREEWLEDMVIQGQKKHILDDEDAKVIQSQIKEPYIQKYLKSLAVHVCTLPVTQVVSVIVSWIYVMLHPELSAAESMAAVAAILVLFQITPISPGSLVRGFYVLYMVIKERNFKDYNIALFLGFFKYIGYLAFPIQMTYRYPALARFMAGHWATEAVHIIPVFGESGALLEHWIFRLFYNWPLTIRRRMSNRAQIRSQKKARFWHMGIIILGATSLLVWINLRFFSRVGHLAELKDLWWLSILVPFISGVLITLGARGASLSKRIISSVFSAAMIALFTAISIFLWKQGALEIGLVIKHFLWDFFIFTIFSAVGTLLTELILRDPGIKIKST
jgi:hypothetical protein